MTLFDPEQTAHRDGVAAGALDAAAASDAPPDVYPVAEVGRYLRELVEGDPHLTAIWVAGEVSNLTHAASGHSYFTLKDQQAALRCVLFRDQGAGQRDRLMQGVSLVVHGSFTFYGQRGELNMRVDFVQPEGTGALQAELERRRARFEADGLFAADRKRPLPRFPRRIGVVTSPTGAVWSDIRTVLARRWPLAELVLQPAIVQGPAAAASIADAIRQLGTSRTPDVIIVARGGGAAEELWPFNEEAVVRAVFGAPVPVVSAVGHETDSTLADLVADVRAATPSAAAELISPDRADVAREVAGVRGGIEAALARRLAAAHDDLELAVADVRRGVPGVAAAREAVADRLAAASAAIAMRLDSAREQLVASAGRLRALSPEATLRRGFAIVERPDGETVTSAATLGAGDALRLRFADGRRAVRVEDAAEPGAAR